jgi:hypothetical protein
MVKAEPEEPSRDYDHTLDGLRDALHDTVTDAVTQAEKNGEATLQYAGERFDITRQEDDYLILHNRTPSSPYSIRGFESEVTDSMYSCLWGQLSDAYPADEYPGESVYPAAINDLRKAVTSDTQHSPPDIEDPPETPKELTKRLHEAGIGYSDAKKVAKNVRATQYGFQRGLDQPWGMDLTDEQRDLIRSYDYRLQFGMYEGKTIAEVATSERGRGWLQWAIRNLDDQTRREITRELKIELGVEIDGWNRTITSWPDRFLQSSSSEEVSTNSESVSAPDADRSAEGGIQGSMERLGTDDFSESDADALRVLGGGSASIDGDATGRQSPAGWESIIEANLWEKYGKSRLYLNCYVYDGSGSQRRQGDLGYIDLHTGKIHGAGRIMKALEAVVEEGGHQRRSSGLPYGQLWQECEVWNCNNEPVCVNCSKCASHCTC